MLIGSKLVGWIGRKNNLARLTASTRVQLRIGQEVSDAITTVNEVQQTVMKCLNRDADWVSYHASELGDAAQAAPVNELALRIAGSERRSFKLQQLGQFEKAIQVLEKLIDDKALAVDAQHKAWLSALAARMAFQMEDEPRGQKLQTSAFSVNNNHTPPKVRPGYVFPHGHAPG